jgi:alcohol dehydrogenase/L-iditol 2-dehydrogenase
LEFSLDPLVQKAAHLQGSFSHNFLIWEKVISLLASGKLDPTLIVGRVEPLAGWRACFEEMAGGNIVKALLTPE